MELQGGVEEWSALGCSQNKSPTTRHSACLGHQCTRPRVSIVSKETVVLSSCMTCLREAKLKRSLAFSAAGSKFKHQGSYRVCLFADVRKLKQATSKNNRIKAAANDEAETPSPKP